MKWKKSISYFFLACIILLADVAFKCYVHYRIPPIYLSSPVYPFGGIPVFHNWHGIDLAITNVANKGAAWGMFASLHDYLLYVRILIIGGLLSYLVFAKTSSFRKMCMLLIVTGAIGNVLDTVIYGHVVDMFYVILWGYSNPVFNLADVAIFCGVVLLLLEALVGKLKAGKSIKKNVKGSA